MTWWAWLLLGWALASAVVGAWWGSAIRLADRRARRGGDDPAERRRPDAG